MIKEIKTDRFEGLAVLVPEGLISIDMYSAVSGNYISCSNSTSIKIPNGKWHLVGNAKDFTEENAFLVVESFIKRVNIPQRHQGYMDSTQYLNYYSDLKFEDSFSSAIESFESLMQSMGCYSVNPYGEEPKDIPDLGAFTQAVRKQHQQWKKAQETTGTWIILKKEANR